MWPTPQLDTPQVVNEDGRISVDVNWDDAELLRDQFLKSGLPGTVVLDPIEHRAKLQLWNDADPAQVRTVLAGWKIKRGLQPADDLELPLPAALAADVVDDLASPTA